MLRKKAAYREITPKGTNPDRQLEDLANGCIKQPIIRHEPKPTTQSRGTAGRCSPWRGRVQSRAKLEQSKSKLKLSKATEDRRGQVWGQVAGRGEGAAWHAIEKFAL